MVDVPMNEIRRAAWVGVLLATAGAVLWAGEDAIVSVYVDGKLVSMSPAARVRGGTTYAPLRAAATAVGASVKWQAASQTAIVCSGDRCVPIRKSQGIIVDDQLLIPVRAMSEALACEVKWDAGARAVRINRP
jgi:hypothetical protein